MINMGISKAMKTEKVEEPKTYFPSMEVENDESLDEVPMDYEFIRLDDLGDEAAYIGRPVMKPITAYTFDNDGEEQTKHRSTLYLVNDEEEEVLQININLKSGDEIQSGINKGSVLYDFIGSLKEMEVPGYMENYNKIKKFNLNEAEDFINSLTKAEIRVVEHEFQRRDGNPTIYYGFHFINVEMAQD